MPKKGDSDGFEVEERSLASGIVLSMFEIQMIYLYIIYKFTTLYTSTLRLVSLNTLLDHVFDMFGDR